MTRVLVTGSRSWVRANVIRDALDQAAYGAAQRHLTVVHGASGAADMAADAHAKRRGWTVEPHPANWSAPCGTGCRRDHRKQRRNGDSYCPAAGVYRNQVMVDTRPDVLLAFVREHSTGAEDCIRRAQRAAIPVVAHYDCDCHTEDGTPISDQLAPLNGGLF